MERLSGAIMVLAGVALGSYLYFPSSNDFGNATTATHVGDAPNSDVRLVATPTVVPASTRQDAQAVGQTGATADAGVRVFSPSAPLVESVPGATGASTTTWTAIVATDSAANATLKSPKAADNEARAHLTSDLQRELKRVGCYDGEINGAWTQSTRRAMTLFMERVNATLPAAEPDYILLTLVQGHTAQACGTDCPAGEVYGNDGRCLPAAVVAQANKRAQRYEERLAERRESERRKAAQQEQLAAEQRIAEARRIAVAQRAEAERLAQGRATERRNAQRLAAANSAASNAARAKPAQIASVNAERLPWQNAPSNGRAEQRQEQLKAASTYAEAPVAARAEPLPGMMSVGGPRNATVATATGTTTVATATGTATVGEPAIAGSAGAMRDSIDRGGSVDQDDLSARRNYMITAPVPRPAVRPAPLIRQAALNAGLPETRPSRVEHPTDFANHQSPTIRKYPPAKIIRRPAAFDSAPRIKRKYYAYNGGGKTRRGQPRPGTARYNVMQSLGGIY